jgi:hypothetical protein
MKHIKKVIFIILILIAGCDSGDKKDNQTAQNIITLSDSELDKQYKASDIFADITLIPLETSDESIIGSVYKITIIDSIIYILDDKSMSLLLFDMHGHFVSKIHRRGNGPNEYVCAEDFTVMKNKDILILDEYKKLLHFKNDGTPYKTYHTSFIADALEPLNDTLIVFNGSSFEDRVIIWNITNGKVEKSFIKYHDKHGGRIFKPLIRYYDSIYFTRPLSSMIYKVTAEQLTEQWFIDFGKRNITDDKIVKIEYGIPAIYPDIMEMFKFTETKTHVMFSFQVEDLKDGMPYFVYYSKSTGKKIIVIYDMYNNDMSFNRFPQAIFDATESGQVFEVLHPESYVENISKCDTAAMNPETKQRWRYVRKQLKGVTEFDNPIVALYSLKDF